MKFALIPAGSFTRRSVLSPTKNFTVSLTRPYYLGVTEVNQKQFRRLMGTADSYFQGDLLPVDQATWERAVEFCRRLSELPEEKAAGRTYRLPTEAEWEFASRAGSGKAFFFGENLQQADMFVWYSENSKSIIQDVGIKLPNNWGLYDIYGNVTEWCSDWLAEYPAEGQVDPHGPPAGEYKIIRGGNCGGELWYANSTFRHYGKVRGSEIGLAGLRVICEITEAIHSESEPENTTPFKD
jgi:formylglycine-generating enzyme required for sulfatase activity